MKARQKEFLADIEKLDENIEMIKITDHTVFDYYFSEKRAFQIGIKNYAPNGEAYIERIRHGKKPILSAKYNDLVLVYSGKIKYDSPSAKIMKTL